MHTYYINVYSVDIYIYIHMYIFNVCIYICLCISLFICAICGLFGEPNLIPTSGSDLESLE